MFISLTRRVNRILRLAHVITVLLVLQYDRKHHHFSVSTDLLHRCIPVVRNVDWLGPRQFCQMLSPLVDSQASGKVLCCQNYFLW
ncbi:Molybdopterin biosynthesis protein CNX1 [Fusarium oxysporum f. sp. albedinis]|nr:Molybdopterin biosynthesis protein CNX1 [Fusarium oxysporum f. sp. albedinis]